MKTKSVTKKTKIKEILQKHPEMVEALMDAGMGCAMCPVAHQETLEQGCLAHGMSEKDIDKLLNKVKKKK